MITCYICNQEAPSHKLDCPNRLGPVTISANSARILNDDHAELVDARAKLAAIHGWAEQIADRYGDQWDHHGGCQGDGEDGCPLCRILAATGGSEVER